MKKGKLSRRNFLRMAGGLAAGTALAACQPRTVIVEKEVEKVVTQIVKETVKETVVVEGTPKVVEKEVTKIVEKVVEVTAAPTPQPEPVTLEFFSSTPEYDKAREQVWAIYEAMNPHVTIELVGFTEGLSQDQMLAKRAGGWYPAIDQITVDPNNAELYVNLLETDFPWFDRWQYDVRAASEQLIGVPGVYTLNPEAGFVWSWMYHADLMEEAGLDPRNDVKTWDDLKAWLDAGTAWAASRDDIAFFWDWGWSPFAVSMNIPEMIPPAFPDGQRDRLRAAWLGQIPFAGEDSPYRHYWEFLQEAHQNGWVPEKFWLREWEPDHEANIIAKRSVVTLHGPWIWNKVLAEDPSAQLLGLPTTPPAEGQDPWVSAMSPPRVNSGNGLDKRVLEDPIYPEIQKAFNWWLSPEAVRMYAESIGTLLVYETDEPLELEGAQWDGFIKEVGRPGGLWEDAVWEASQVGFAVAAKCLREDAPYSNWQRDWPGWFEILEGLCGGTMEVQAALAKIEDELLNPMWERPCGT
jgi:ABC-type glycerol-3-phosphate transport system substrate-binding protein